MGSSTRSSKVGPLADFGNSRRNATHTQRSDVAFKDRHMTDVFFLIFFICFLTIVISLFIFNVYFYDDCFYDKEAYSTCSSGCENSYMSPTENVMSSSTSLVDIINFDEYNISYRSKPNLTDLHLDFLQMFLMEVSEDFESCWTDIFTLCSIGLGSSIIIIIFYRYFIGALILMISLGTIILCSIMTIILWFLWWDSEQPSDPKHTILIFEDRKKMAYFIFALLATLLTFVISSVLLALRKRIQLMISLFQESGKAISNMPVLLIQPILTLLFMGVILSVSFFSYITLEKISLCSKNKNHEYDRQINVTKGCLVFATLWFWNLVIGCQHMIVAGAVSTWYFGRRKNIFDAYHKLIRYHLGSVALGSFLIAYFQMLRIVLEILHRYLYKSERKCLHCCVRCLKCYLYIVENIIKYLSRNAYIEIAMNGYNFCHATKEAFRLISSNVLLTTTINSIGYFILFVGKIAAVTITVFLTIQILKNKNLQHLWLLVTFIGLFTYIISHCFITVYEMSTETIFLCFCKDFEENNGIDKPYFMSRNLMKFIQDSRKVMEAHPKEKRNEIPTISKNTDTKNKNRNK